MSTLIGFVVLYILASIAIGLYAALRVKTSKDYVVAGRSLPLYITTATVFATWFGSETVLGTSSTFLDENLGGIIADPFGASACLIIVGVFFARHLYKMNLLTIGDFYRRRYNRTIEVFVSIAICISYLGWVSAQIAALGLVFNVISDGMISREMGMLVGITVVLIYTMFGGMWSVALTDFIQMVIICAGMLFICYMISGMVDGGAGAVIQHAMEADKFDFWPPMDLASVLVFAAGFLTMALGSVPQQDVFQRVMSAKDEKTAVRGSVLGGSLYFLFAFIPIFIAYSATLIDPSLVAQNMGPDGDTQLILPSFIMSHMPIYAQVIFFGALLSAIMSTASGTLLAPSALFAENILKPMLRHMDDKHLLKLLRMTVVGFAGLVLIYSYYSTQEGVTIFEMVENAYMVTLCGAFVPLAFGVYWKRANTAGATLSILMGVSTWVFLQSLAYNLPEGSPELIVPPQLAGLGMAIAGMLLGGYIGKRDYHHHHHHGSGHHHGDHTALQAHGHGGGDDHPSPAPAGTKE
jgi:SSS family solute:Na+ symporter